MQQGYSNAKCVLTQLRKTRMCVRYLQGNSCPNEATCVFAHSVDELERKPDLRKTRLCKAFAKGRCPYATCTFAHGEPELRYTDMFYKTSLCTFNNKDACRNGDSCRFAHGEEELRSYVARLQDGSSTPPLSERDGPALPWRHGSSELSTAGDDEPSRDDGPSCSASSAGSGEVAGDARNIAFADKNLPDIIQLTSVVQDVSADLQPATEWPDTDSDDDGQTPYHRGGIDSTPAASSAAFGSVGFSCHSPETQAVALATSPLAAALMSSMATASSAPTMPAGGATMPAPAAPSSASSRPAGQRTAEMLLQSLAQNRDAEPVVGSLLSSMLAESMDELRWQQQVHGRTQVRVDASFDSLLERIRHDVYLLAAKCSQVQRTMHCHNGSAQPTVASNDWRGASSPAATQSQSMPGMYDVHQQGQYPQQHLTSAQSPMRQPMLPPQIVQNFSGMNVGDVGCRSPYVGQPASSWHMPAAGDRSPCTAPFPARSATASYGSSLGEPASYESRRSAARRRPPAAGRR